MRIVLFFLLLLSSFSCKPDRRSKEVLPQTEAAIEAGDFVLDSVAGGPHSLKEFKGRVVLLNFFTTWCPYCSQEIPHLKDLIEKFGKDGRFVLMGVDIGEGSDKVKQFARKHNISYEILLDKSARFSQIFGVRGVPSNFLLDKDGKVVFSGHNLPPEEEIVKHL